MFQRGPAYSLGSNQIRVSTSTYVFEMYMLQVKVNRRNYNFYVAIYITQRQSCHEFTAQLKYAAKMYAIIYIK